MKYYSIHEFSKLIGRTPQTLRNWDASGRLHPHHTGASGYRYYSHQQLNEVLGITDKSRKVIGYCRVSSNKQKDDLERQVENMKKYLSSIECEYEIIQDIGSGINYTKKGLRTLLQRIKYTPSPKDFQSIGHQKPYMLAFDVRFSENLKVTEYSKEISKIVVFYKDRLLRFGFELVEYMANLNGCGIEVLDSTEKTEQEELVEDLIQIVTVFSCRL